jgi:hypothetical protein
MRVRLAGVEAGSAGEAERKALDLVKKVVPAHGYRLAVEEAVGSHGAHQGERAA